MPSFRPAATSFRDDRRKERVFKRIGQSHNHSRATHKPEQFPMSRILAALFLMVLPTALIGQPRPSSTTMPCSARAFSTYTGSYPAATKSLAHSLGRDLSEEVSGGLPESLVGAGCGLAQECLQLRKGVLDPRVKPEGVDVRAVGRQQHEPGAVASILARTAPPDGPADCP